MMNKELIYKEDALRQLYLDHKDVIYIDKQETAGRIRKLKAVNPYELKQCGHWIHINILNPPYVSENAYQCSCCGYIPKYKDEFITNITIQYCPSCGAYMIETNSFHN